MKYSTVPTILETYSFEEFVEYGKRHAANLVKGAPWAFVFEGIQVTHETDERYLLSSDGFPIPFTPRDILAKIEGAWCRFDAESFREGHIAEDFNSESPVAQTKILRLAIKEAVERLNGASRKSRSRSLAITKLEEASMWLGKDLQELNEPNPYPNSHNPESLVIDPSAPEACAISR